MTCPTCGAPGYVDESKHERGEAEREAPQRYQVFTDTMGEEQAMPDNKRGRWVRWDDVKDLYSRSTSAREGKA